jgi:hypothetical protein
MERFGDGAGIAEPADVVASKRGEKLAVIAAASLAACMPAYQPGSFTRRQGPFTGERVTVRCLDLAIERRADMNRSAVIEYEFGNRCNFPQVVDFASLRVIGRAANGAERALQPYDPRGELVALRLGGRYRGREAIAYPSGEPIAEVCVDAASLVHAEPERWVCMSFPTVEVEP